MHGLRGAAGPGATLIVVPTGARRAVLADVRSRCLHDLSPEAADSLVKGLDRTASSCSPRLCPAPPAPASSSRCP
ncbi:hypothetical protein [Streptosporangium vulgare]|uniref:hypothetical protein n=1 Tax=Streptosporangium vulgare TaxID=46190 RepID=UPI0031DFF527